MTGKKLDQSNSDDISNILEYHDDPLEDKIINLRENEHINIQMPMTEKEEKLAIKEWKDYDFLSNWNSYFIDRSDVPEQYVISTGYYIISSIIGNYFKIYVPDRPKENPNIWLLHIGHSQRSRKSFISNSTLEFLRKSGFENDIIADKFTVAGFGKELQEKNQIQFPRAIWRRNDGSAFFEECSLKYMIGAQQELCNLYDGYGSKYRKSDDTVRVPPIHFLLYLNIPTPSSRCILPEHFESGLLNRVSISYPQIYRDPKPYIDVPDHLKDDDENTMDSDDYIDFTDNRGKQMINYINNLHRIIQWRALQSPNLELKIKLTNSGGYEIKKYEKEVNINADSLENANPLLAGYIRASTRRLVHASGINVLMTDPWPENSIIKIRKENVKNAIKDIIMPEIEGAEFSINEIMNNPVTRDEIKYERHNDTYYDMVKKVGKKGIECRDLMRKFKGTKAYLFWGENMRTLGEREEIIIVRMRKNEEDNLKKYAFLSEYREYVENEFIDVIIIPPNKY